MAYTKQTWQCGDTISAEKLNHMEDGISQGGGIETNIQNPTDGQTLKYDAESGKWVNGEGGGSSTLIVNIGEEEILDKTWQEIRDAFPNVMILRSSPSADVYVPVSCFTVVSSSTYVVSADGTDYSTNSPSGYPEANIQ